MSGMLCHQYVPAENVRIILLEASYSCETRERTGSLVSVQHTKISHTECARLANQATH